MKSEKPAILFHITHWKAGSQWIRKILEQCNSNGNIYPSQCITHEEFQRLTSPNPRERFVVLRDLRDTLISAYFSFKISHPILPEHSLEAINALYVYRKKLNELSLEDGLIYILHHWLPGCAKIHDSWLKCNEPIIRYEDLLQADLEILAPHVLPHISLSPSEFEKIVIANRFQSLTKGRKPGDEDINSHERKALPGDWKNYFTESLKKEFKSIFGDLIIKSKYENNNNW